MTFDNSRGNIQVAVADRYQIGEQIGQGGMATVYLGRDRRHERNVAIKVLRPDVSMAMGAERFMREIRVLARLQHANILPLFDSGATNDVLYFVMPFVDGESLRALLDREGALGLVETVRILRQVADALDYAHACGVVHRDLKPENVLLAGRQVALADFGVARILESDAVHDGTLTSIGFTIGTPMYMSPEQAAAEQNVDGRSDVYGLGCMCFEMLAGGPPFRGSTAMALIRQHIAALPPALVGARQTLPAAACAAVARALAKEPADRFPTAGDFVVALEEALVRATPPSAADLHQRAEEKRHQAREKVLVLEFTNLAGDASADWLSTGIAETVSADLQKVAGIRSVTLDAPSRARHAAGGGRLVEHALALELGRSVGARWVVSGAFQKSGGRVRITTHVANTEGDDLTREEKVDGEMADIFALQDRIVDTVAAAIQIELTSAEVEQIRRPETTHLSAYEHYARGFRARLLMGKESAKVAEQHFLAAIALDSNYALAFAGLGALHVPMYIATGRREVLDEAAGLLERAIALDPTLGESYAWLAYMLARQQRFNDAEAAARRAIELNPQGYDGWYMLGTARALRAFHLHEPHAFVAAINAYLRAIHVRSESFSSYTALASLYLLRGAYGHAAAPIETALQRELADPGVRVLGPLILRATLHMGRTELHEAERLLDRAVRRYDGADHVYAEAMTCHALWTRACVAERREDAHRALEDFSRVVEIAEAFPHRISIGAHWAKAQFGRVRVLHRTGRAGEAARVLADTDALLATRERFVWSWYAGGSDGEVLYARASALATVGRSEEAVAGLRKAAEACWSDVTWLRHDPAFIELRDTRDVVDICSAAIAMVELPPPIGQGGLA